jgi:hypothetical protein
MLKEGMNRLYTFGCLLLATALLGLPAAASAQGSERQSPQSSQVSSLGRPSSETPRLSPAGREVQLQGNVVRMLAGQLRLESGETVYVNSGTVINPPEASLVGNPRVVVKGYPNSQDPSGSVNATEIDVLR